MWVEILRLFLDSPDRIFETIFQTVRAEFRDCFRTVRVEISRLFSDSPDRIFETIFGQSGTDVYRVCGVFRYHSNPVTNREWTKRCPVVYGFEIWAILCVIV